MKVNVVVPEELNQDELARWRELQSSSKWCSSPYFTPEYAAIVGKVRSCVRVAIVEAGGVIQAFFPFEVRSFGMAKPAGTALADFQGLIAAPDFHCTAKELLRGAGLATFHFTHVIDGSPVFGIGPRTSSAPSPQINLEHGFEAWAGGRRAAGVRIGRSIRRKLRNIARDLGPVQFCAASDSDAALNQLIEWKQMQYRRTGRVPVFDKFWIRELLKIMKKAQSKTFAGMLSTLSAGGILLSADFGMRSKTVWHSWFGAYNPCYAKYSPGLAHLYVMCQTAPDLGICLIDLGRGNEAYKRELANAAVNVIQGSVGSGIVHKMSGAGWALLEFGKYLPAGARRRIYLAIRKRELE